MIISRTPYRISFFGGGTDYPAWYRQHGGAVLATSIDKYCYLSARFLPPRPMLQRCAGKFPLVMFIHGMAPQGAANAGFHRAWWRIAVGIAGIAGLYVVG